MARKNKTDENNPINLEAAPPGEPEKMTKKVSTHPMTVTPKGRATVQTTVEITEYLTIPAARKELGDGVVLKLINDALAAEARTKRRNEIVSGGVEQKMDSLLKRLSKINPDVAKAAEEMWGKQSAQVENASTV